MNIKTPSDLKYFQQQKGVEPYFFTRSTMKFWGDTMANYGLRRNTVTDQYYKVRPVFELHRKRPVKHGMRSSTFFDVETLERVHAIKD